MFKIQESIRTSIANIMRTIEDTWINNPSLGSTKITRKILLII